MLLLISLPGGGGGGGSGLCSNARSPLGGVAAEGGIYVGVAFGKGCFDDWPAVSVFRGMGGGGASGRVSISKV